MRKILVALFAVIGCICFTACQQEDGVSGNGEGGGSSYVEDGFSLNLILPGTKANAYTTISPIRTESDIYSLHLVFFEKTTDGSGAYQGFYSVDIDPDTPLDIYNSIDVRFDESSGLSNKESYNILLVANLDWFLQGMTIQQWIASLPFMTEQQAKDQTRAYVTGEPDETIYSEGLDRLPMSATAVKEAMVSNVSAILDRTVARIDVTSYLGTTYDLVSASLWNGFPYSSIWEGAIDYSDARIQRYYGLLTEPRSNGQYDLINGGLYTFENYVETPGANDRLTTCAIIGMRNLDATAPDYNMTLYYRINIHPYDSPQKLERNSSYNITIRGVLDKGYKTELEAYLGEADKLDIVINYWDLDDDGMIQYDGDNILAVPMKRINIPYEGDEREYSIFTLGEGKTLTITRNTVPAGIDVRLDGNMLYVNSQSLTSAEPARSGEVDLTFGSLKATVYINQSGEFTGEYVEVSPSTLNVFPAYGATTSETIVVTASGSWTAKLFNEGFSFSPGATVTEIKSSQGNTFTVSTTGSNPDNSSRVGFLVVSLDSNPDINRSIVMQQRGQGGLSLYPDAEIIYFDADGSVNLSYNNTFSVDPGDNGNGTVNPWKVVLESDAHFYISEYVYDPANLSKNTFTVSARGENTGIPQLQTTVKVYIEDEPSVNKTMKVVQGRFNLALNPTEFDVVPAAGGIVGPVTVTCTTGRNWTASISTTTDVDGHSALLVDGTGNAMKQLKGTDKGTFRIQFPRLTLTNQAPQATITVRLDGTDQVKTFNVSQTNLVPRKLRFNSKGVSYGTLMTGHTGYNHINIFGDNLFNSAYFGTSANSVVKTGGMERTHGYSKPINPAITNFHANQGCHAYKDAIITWLKSDHRNFLSVCLDIDQADQQLLLRQLSGSYTVAAGGVATKVKRSLSQTPASYRSTKVWEYLTKTGPFTNGVQLDIDKTAFYNGDGTNGCLTSWPSTTIPIIMHPTKSNACMLAVDPVHKVVIIGDTEMFCRRNTASNMNDFTQGNDNWKFLNNLLAFMVNAGMYGDDFLNEFR